MFYSVTLLRTIAQETASQIALRNCSQEVREGASVVVQWLGIRLPMQGTRVRVLVREDPTCHGETKPVHHTY